MKRIFLLLCLLFPCRGATAQSKSPGLSALYISMGGGSATTSKGVIGIGGTFVLANNWGGGISIRSTTRRAKNTPSDYVPGFIILGDGYPTDNINCTSFMLLKNFPLGSMTRASVQAGPSVTQLELATFTKRPGSFLFPYSYDTHYSAESSVGLSLSAKVEWTFCRFVGLELESFSNINQYHSFAGIEFHLTLGYVRAKRDGAGSSVKQY